MKTLEQLLDAESSWPEVQELLQKSPLTCEIVEAPCEERVSTLVGLQVTVHSLLGALAWGCGVIAIDFGWVRLLGAGVGTLPGLHIETLNDVAGSRSFEGIVAAVDILGGRFAVHGGGLKEVAPGEVLYFAPDTLEWMPTGMGHAALVEFLLSDRLDVFYADLRWAGWEGEVRGVPLDQGLAAYPFPWTQEGRGPGVSRSAVPLAELIGFAEDAAAQLRGTDSN